MSSSATTKRSVEDPNVKGSGKFVWVVLAVLAIAAVVIGLVVWQSANQRTSDLAERASVEYSGEMRYADGVVTLSAADVAEGTPEVSLYEDLSCPHCAALAGATDEQMLQEVENGNLIVNIHPLNFMDKGADGHSTNSLAALLRLAEAGDANAYLNLRRLLFEDQKSVYNQWGPEQFAEAAKAFDGSGDAVDAIRAGDVSQAKTVGQDNGDQLEELTGTVSSPRILQDGKDIEIQDMNQWVSQVVGQ